MKPVITDTQSGLQAHKEYLESRILSAHPVEIVNMLYEVAIDNLEAAIAHLKTGDRFARSAAITKAETAVDELILSIDPTVKASFIPTLRDLYQYILHQMILGHARQSESSFREALSILMTLSSAWKEVKLRVCNAAGHDVEAPEEEKKEELELAATNPYAGYASASGSRDWSA
jgi:flagellar protein FliS